MKHLERGSALIETAFALPVILIAFYAVTWAVRVGTVTERLEGAVRYAGVISAEQDTFHDYSLYSLYNNLGNTDLVKTLECAPPTNLYVNGGALPTVPGTPAQTSVLPSFWLPDSGSVQTYCLSASGRQVFTGDTRSYLLLQSIPNMNATVSDTLFTGPLTSGTVSTSVKFYRSADISTIMHCVPAINSAISASLNPTQYGTSIPVKALMPSDFDPDPIPVTPGCANAIGAQTPAPAPAPYSPAPGSTPVPSPGPAASPTAQPSVRPTTPAGSPAPGVTATPGASPIPAPTATPPAGGPGGGPTTPAPSVTPATPRPSSKPTTSPTKTPQPTPTPYVPPGNTF